LVSLSQLQEVPPKSMILLVGAPGSGKSTFCQQAALQSLAMDKPIIFVTTEYGPSEAERALRERGLREVEAGLLNFVNVYHETVGLSVSDRADTVHAHCEDLSSIGIAISKLSERIGRKGVLLVFDSLTAPYLFSGSEVLRFMRMTLSGFAAEGNAVLACFDEGCGKSEDLVAMMSLSNGVIKMERDDDKLLLNVVKHPKVRPTKIEAPTEPERVELKPTMRFDPSVVRQFTQAMVRGDKASVRRETGDFVNSFWPNLAHWSCMLWDPKRFPTMIYELNKEDGAMSQKAGFPYLPWQMKFLIKIVLPKSFSRTKDMKKLASRWPMPQIERSGIIEYLEDNSRTDEHYFRIYECSDCWGFENAGAAIASHLPPMFAGFCIALESLKGLERDWNAVETKCVGLGDPYCEWKVVPGEIDELKDSLEKDSSVIGRIHERLMDRLTGFLLDGKPLVETRPKLGSDVRLHVVMHAMGFPHVAGERYRMAQRMGGAKSGKEIGERLLDAGIAEDEAVKRVLHLLDYCKVGKVSTDETIRIKENVESLRTLLFATERKEPCCYFTTGFLNGFFSAVKNQHVKETKCIVLGDPYCEWEFS
jgi:predicted hydrocarbon binding protein/KaiC/GvpD/RAD55 family RecA-like ATPase